MEKELCRPPRRLWAHTTDAVVLNREVRHLLNKKPADESAGFCQVKGEIGGFVQVVAGSRTSSVPLQRSEAGANLF
jgi:hypothetical protein